MFASSLPGLVIEITASRFVGWYSRSTASLDNTSIVTPCFTSVAPFLSLRTVNHHEPPSLVTLRLSVGHEVLSLRRTLHQPCDRIGHTEEQCERTKGFSGLCGCTVSVQRRGWP